MDLDITPIKADMEFHIKCLVYGGSGMGKTHLITTLDENGYKPLVLNTDRGQLTFKKYLDRTGKQIDSIRLYFERDDPNESKSSLWEKLQINWKKIRQAIAKGDFPYKVICVDSISELVKVCLDEVTAGKKPNQNDYGVVNDRIRKFLKELRDIPVAVYAICGVEEKQNDQGEMTVRPAVQGRLNTDIFHNFDLAMYADIRTVEKDGESRDIRYLITSAKEVPGVGKVYAKDRSGLLNEHEKPNLSLIFDKMLGKNVEKAEQITQPSEKNEPVKKEMKKTSKGEI